MATATGIGVTGMDIVAYLVKDAKRAVAFYRDVIGLPVSYEAEQGAEFELSDGTTFGVWQMLDGSWHPHAGVMFAVPDPHAAFEYLKKQGVKMHMTEVLETPACFMFACEDPDGNGFIIHKRKES